MPDAGWLVAHQATVQLYVLIAAFAVVAVWESFRPLRSVATATPGRWITNVVLAGLGSVVVRLVFPVFGVGFAVLAGERGWGLLNVVAAPAWLSFVVAVIAIDAAQYGLHRLSHAAPVLWRMHKIHHADLDVDCATAIRHHPLEHLYVSGASLLLIGALGAPPLAVVAASLVGTAASIFNHGNVVVSPDVDRLLRRVVVTPDMHRIHHSMQDDECNANFSMLLPWWDHLFGTYRGAPRDGHAQMTLGIADARAAGDVTLPRLLLLPFRRNAAVLPASISSAR